MFVLFQSFLLGYDYVFGKLVTTMSLLVLLELFSFLLLDCCSTISFLNFSMMYKLPVGGV